MRVNNLLAGLVIAAITWLLAWLIRENSPYAPDLPHHYGIVGMGSVVVFAVVFRTNLGWQRYWEAMTQQHFMYSKWADAYSQFFAFATVTLAQTKAKGGEQAQDKAERVQAIMDSLLKNFSMLSVFAADRLFHGDTQRMEERADSMPWAQQVVLRKELGADRCRGISDGRLPRMVTVEDLVTDMSSSKKKPNEEREPYTVVARLSPEEQDVLAQITDRVGAVMYWILHDLAQVSKDIDIAPPVQSRMYQELSNGMLGFNNSLKIADVPFPFPYAQLLTLALVAFSCCIPVYVAVFTEDLITGPLVAFFIFQGMWGVNEVAKELENPFGSDVNDISLQDFHERFVQALRETNVAHQCKLNHNAVLPNGKAAPRRIGMHPIAYRFGARSQSKMGKDLEVQALPSDALSAISIPFTASGGAVSDSARLGSNESFARQAVRPPKDDQLGSHIREEKEVKVQDSLGAGFSPGGVGAAERRQSPDTKPQVGGVDTGENSPVSPRQDVMIQLDVAEDHGISTKVPRSLRKRERTASAASTSGAGNMAFSLESESEAGGACVQHNMEMLDRRILEIGTRMEGQLVQIARSVDSLSQALASMALSVNPLINRGSSRV